MYGLPANFNAAIFTGHEVEQVCFTQNTIHIVFSGDISITLLSSRAFDIAVNNTSHDESDSFRLSSLIHLVGKKINSATANPDGAIVLSFEEGSSLTCLDDSAEYESYSIGIGEDEIIV